MPSDRQARILADPQRYVLRDPIGRGNRIPGPVEIKSMDDCNLFDRMRGRHVQLMSIPGVTFRGSEGNALIYSLHETPPVPIHVHCYDSDEGLIPYELRNLSSIYYVLRCECGQVFTTTPPGAPQHDGGDWTWTDEGQLVNLKRLHKNGLISTTDYNAEYSRISTLKYNRSKGHYA